MSLKTTVKTTKAKICLFSWENKLSNNDHGEELYLQERKPDEDDDKQIDHLFMQKVTNEEGELKFFINDREVEPRIIEEIIRFLV